MVRNSEKLSERLSEALLDGRAVREKFAELQALVHLNEARFLGFGGILHRHRSAMTADTSYGMAELSALVEASSRYWDLGFRALTKTQDEMNALRQRMNSVREGRLGTVAEINPEYAWVSPFVNNVTEKRKREAKGRKRSAK